MKDKVAARPETEVTKASRQLPKQGGDMRDEAKAGNTEKLYLSEEELYDLTRYRRPSNQLKMLQSLGIPALKRADNTVLVLRMHLQYPPSMQPERKPELKSSRQLQRKSEKQRT